MYNLFNGVLLVNTVSIRGNIQVKGTYRRWLQQVVIKLQNCTIDHFCKGLMCVYVCMCVCMCVRALWGVDWCKILNVRRKGGGRGAIKIAKKGGAGSKFWIFCDNVIIECPIMNTKVTKRCLRQKFFQEKWVFC